MASPEARVWNERPTAVGYTPGQVLIPPFVAILDRNQSKQELQKSFWVCPHVSMSHGNCWSIDVRMVFRRFLGPASSLTLILILLWQCAYTQTHLCQLAHLFFWIALSLVSLHQAFAVSGAVCNSRFWCVDAPFKRGLKSTRSGLVLSSLPNIRKCKHQTFVFVER